MSAKITTVSVKQSNPSAEGAAGTTPLDQRIKLRKKEKHDEAISPLNLLNLLSPNNLHPVSQDKYSVTLARNDVKHSLSAMRLTDNEALAGDAVKPEHKFELTPVKKDTLAVHNNERLRVDIPVTTRAASIVPSAVPERSRSDIQEATRQTGMVQSVDLATVVQRQPVDGSTLQVVDDGEQLTGEWGKQATSVNLHHQGSMTEGAFIAVRPQNIQTSESQPKQAPGAEQYIAKAQRIEPEGTRIHYSFNSWQSQNINGAHQVVGYLSPGVTTDNKVTLVPSTDLVHRTIADNLLTVADEVKHSIHLQQHTDQREQQSRQWQVWDDEGESE